MTRADADPAGTGRFRAGDPLRALSALGVLVVHCANFALAHTGHPELLARTGSLVPGYGEVLGTVMVVGAQGLNIFLCLSGYLIARPWISAVVHGLRPPRLGAYLLNRALRILPAFWVVAALVLLLNGTRGASSGEVVSVFTLTADWLTNPLSYDLGHVWTLTTEAQFYLAVPLLLLPLAAAWPKRPHRSATSRAALLLVGLAALTVSNLVWVSGPTEAGDRSLLDKGYLVEMGLGLAVLSCVVPERVRGRKSVARAGAVCVLLACALLLILSAKLLPREAHKPVVALAVLGLVGGPLLREWAAGRSWRALDNPVLQWLGSRSYAFYLVHVAISEALARALAPLLDGRYKVLLLVLVPLAFALAAVAAEVLHRLVERPFLSLKRREGSRPVLDGTVASAPS